jgi:hypothetical protein
MIPMDETKEALLMDASPEQAGQITEVFDTMDAIMLIDCGEPDEAQYIAAFQVLIDSGLAWNLQGSYARMASALIASGHCHK